jgi:hypothetical protein
LEKGTVRPLNPIAIVDLAPLKKDSSAVVPQMLSSEKVVIQWASKKEESVFS